MRLSSSVIVLGIIAALAATNAAEAQQPAPTAQRAPTAPEPAPTAKEKRAERKEDRAERKEDRAERKEDRAERKEDRAERKEDRREESAEEREKWRAERKARRDKRHEELRQRWGALLSDAGVRGELKVHARRMARLRAIKRVAAAEGKTALVARVDKLLEKEQARHQQHMENLKAKRPGSPAASATAGAL